MTVAASIKRLIAPPLAVALLGSCDYLQSFETACARRLPPTSVKVVTEPARYKVDGSESYSQLARRGAEIASYGRTIVGLTTANLSSSVEVTARGMARRGSSRYCMRPEVSVRLSFNPMVVYMGSEDAPESCEYKITYEHEMQHVRVYRDFLPTIAARVETELATHFGNQIYYFNSADDGQQHIDSVVNGYLSPLVAEAMNQVRNLQRDVDAPEEYARLDRLRAACPAGGGFGAPDRRLDASGRQQVPAQAAERG